jgi:hypothetical protein
MQVRMKVEVLTPRMEHREKAGFHAETFGSRAKVSRVSAVARKRRL